MTQVAVLSLDMVPVLSLEEVLGAQQVGSAWHYESAV